MADSLLLGIEIGGTKLQMGLSRGDGRLLAVERRTVEPARGAWGILEQLNEAFKPLLNRVGAAPEILLAVGIGFGGPVDADRGVITKSHHVEGWDGYPLADWVRMNLGVRAVAVANDADTAGLGEARWGAGVGLSPVVYVTIGTGIGGGLILDGQIYRGAGAGALEIGHLRLDGPIYAWRETDCPERRDRILEDIAAGPGIARAGRETIERIIEKGKPASPLYNLVRGDPTQVTAVLVAEAARQGDMYAILVLKAATETLAWALDQVVTLINPRRIILGGGVSLIGEKFWFQPIRLKLREYAFPPFRDQHDLVPAQLGEEVVVHGAMALAQDVAAQRNL